MTLQAVLRLVTVYRVTIRQPRLSSLALYVRRRQSLRDTLKLGCRPPSRTSSRIGTGWTFSEHPCSAVQRPKLAHTAAVLNVRVGACLRPKIQYTSYGDVLEHPHHYNKNPYIPIFFHLDRFPVRSIAALGGIGFGTFSLLLDWISESWRYSYFFVSRPASTYMTHRSGLLWPWSDSSLCNIRYHAYAICNALGRSSFVSVACRFLGKSLLFMTVEGFRGRKCNLLIPYFHPFFLSQLQDR